MECLNCGVPVENKYCAHCGQKTNTKRITFKHFMTHEIFHGVFHLDKIFPKTILEIMKNPGVVASNFIAGKRKRYYNFFYLLLILIGFNLFLRSIFHPEVQKTISHPDTDTFHLGLFLKDHYKSFILTFIPMFTLSAWVMFRRIGYNWLEFTIPATIGVIGSYVCQTLLTILGELRPYVHHFKLFYILIILIVISYFGYPIFTFWQLGHHKYSRLGMIWRLLIFYIIFLLLFLILVLVIGTIINGQIPRTIEFS